MWRGRPCGNYLAILSELGMEWRTVNPLHMSDKSKFKCVASWTLIWSSCKVKWDHECEFWDWIGVCRDGEFKFLIGGGYQDAWVDMNEYFKDKYPERYTEPPRHMEVITNKATEIQKQFTRARISRPPPKKRFILSRFLKVSKRIDNENPTPLNRKPPFHKFYGIRGMSNQPPPCGIHRIWQ